MTKTRYELALIRPGEIIPSPNGSGKTSAEDPKLAVLMSWWTKNIKGNKVEEITQKLIVL